MDKATHAHIHRKHTEKHSIQMLKDRAQQVLRDVVRPTLDYLGLADPIVEKLMMGTCAIESNFVTVTQFPTGPGRGLWQMEFKTHNWLWDDVLQRPKYEDLKVAIQCLLKDGEPISNETCAVNHKYAMALARLRYMMVAGAVPGTLKQQAQYWKDKYNISPNGCSASDYMERWNLLCKPIYPHFS